jgi:hypothetical protein
MTVYLFSRYDQSIHDNIIGFQDDFGLEKDGYLRFGGPTETAPLKPTKKNRSACPGHALGV